MKHKQLILSLAGSCVISSAFGAEPLTAMRWEFDTPDDPALVQPTESNPFGGTGTADINRGAGVGYSSGIFLGDAGYGTATGLWDILAGDVTLSVDLYADTADKTLDYALVVKQFSSPAPGFPYSPNLNFSIPGASLVSQVTTETTTEGFWIESTYSWADVTVPRTIELTVSSYSDGGLNYGFLVDSMAFFVAGNLTPIPEPSTLQLGALAAVGLGIAGLRRQKAAR